MQYVSSEEVIRSDDTGAGEALGALSLGGGVKGRRKDRACVLCKCSPGGRFTAGENLCTGRKVRHHAFRHINCEKDCGYYLLTENFSFRKSENRSWETQANWIWPGPNSTSLHLRLLTCRRGRQDQIPSWQSKSRGLYLHPSPSLQTRE